MSDFFLLCAAFNNSSAAWSQCSRDEVVSLESLAARPGTCRVDRDDATSASASLAHTGMPVPLFAGAADVWAPFPKGVATFVRPGSGRIEPTATPATPASTNTVILRTTSPAQLMAVSDSAARNFKDRRKCLTNDYGMPWYTIKLRKERLSRTIEQWRLGQQGLLRSELNTNSWFAWKARRARAAPSCY